MYLVCLLGTYATKKSTKGLLFWPDASDLTDPNRPDASPVDSQAPVAMFTTKVQVKHIPMCE